MDTSTPPSKRIFVSYAHKDGEWLTQFHTHFKPYVRNAHFDVWADTKLRPSQKWEEIIRTEMESADIGVLLVSPDFLASDFIFDHELPTLLKKKVFWIAVRPSAYKETALNDLQSANDPAKPLALLPPAEQDAAWVEICTRLKEELQNPT